MKLLAVVGSPRPNGNTDILLSQIAAGARAGGAEVDVIRLGRLEVAECDGCHACWRGRDCTKDDDMRLLYPRIADADVIVFGTPVYWYGPTALMKAFIDRFVYFNCARNRPRVRGKKALVALVLEEHEEATWRPVLDFFTRSLAYLEMVQVGSIVVPGVGKAGAILDKPDRLDEAYRLGVTLVGAA